MSAIKDFLTKDYKNSNDIGLLILRLLAGLVLFYGHGLGKLTVIFSGQDIQFMDPIGVGTTFSFYLVAFAEGICAILLILGLFTRLSALVLSITFLVILNHHINDGFQVLELRYFYLFVYVALTFTGAGIFSLDHKFLKAKK